MGLVLEHLRLPRCRGFQWSELSSRPNITRWRMSLVQLQISGTSPTLTASRCNKVRLALDPLIRGIQQVSGTPSGTTMTSRHLTRQPRTLPSAQCQRIVLSPQVHAHSLENTNTMHLHSGRCVSNL